MLKKNAKKDTTDKVFDFEEISMPLPAEEAFQKSDCAWWENNIVLIGVAVAMALMDMMFLFDMLDLAMDQNAMLGRIGAFGIALILNFIPLVIAKQINKARYHLDHHSWIFAITGIVIFTALYLVTVLLRFHCLELYTSSAKAGLTNTVATESTVLEPSNEANRRAVFTALLLSIEPLATSGFSFVLAILTDNPIKKQIDYLEKRKIEIRNARNRISTAIESMWNDKEYLLRSDLEQYLSAKEEIEAEALRLQREARMMLAEKLGDASSISYLSTSDEEKEKPLSLSIDTTGEGVDIHRKHIA